MNRVRLDKFTRAAREVLAGFVASPCAGGIQKIGLRRAEDRNCSNSALFHAAP